jgi:hypothetical protein
MWESPPHNGQQFEPAHVRHPQIADDQIWEREAQFDERRKPIVAPFSSK